MTARLDVPPDRSATTAPIHLDFARRPSALRYMVEAFSPRRPRGAFPPLVARWPGHRIDPRELDRFLALTGLPPGDVLPSVVPMTFGFRLHMAILTDRRAPVAIWRTLQVRNRLAQHRAIPRCATLDFETRVAEQRGLARGTEVDLRTIVHADGAFCWESVVTFLVRGRLGLPEATTMPPPPPEPPADEVAVWTMAAGGGRAFGGFTGDYNGIHLWDAYARRFGFHRALYHPSRVVAECLARLPSPFGAHASGAHASGAHAIDLWLKGPVYRGAAVSLRAAHGPAGTTFALVGADDPRPSIVASIRAGEPT